MILWEKFGFLPKKVSRVQILKVPFYLLPFECTLYMNKSLIVFSVFSSQFCPKYIEK